jgi:uncharacterized protein (DUF2225 family)
MILLLCALIGASDVGKPVSVVCPVDGTKFTATEVTMSNHWGGRDADGCAHAFNTTPLESLVWVCPGCKFAGRKKDFDGTVPDADKKSLIDGLRPLAEIKKGAKQTEIAGAVKYDLLAQVAQIRKAPVEEVGRAWLYAAWSCRQQGAVYLSDFEEWEALRDRYNLNQKPMAFGLGKNRTEFELDVAGKIAAAIEGKQFERGPNKVLARYLAAYLYRKHGENVAAEKWLGELEKVKGENSIVDDAAAKARASIVQERDFQKKALELYKSAYEAKTLAPPTAPEVAYMMGELSRRLGDKKEAVAWYQKSIDTTDNDPLKKLATLQKALADK